MTVTNPGSEGSAPHPYEGPRPLHPADCWMCAPSDDELYRSQHWRVVLNWNQDRLGKVMIALLRHEERVTSLSDAEVLDLWAVTRHVSDHLRELFAPDQFNYSFLMNLDVHAHFHVIPRYEASRDFGGVTFGDLEDGPEHRLPAAEHQRLADALRSRFADPA